MGRRHRYASSDRTRKRHTCWASAITNVLRTSARAVYPIGIWLFCAVLLFKASTTILAGKETALTRAIGFLYKEYDPECFWWELMEMLRKFLLVGLFVTVMPGTIMQISVGTIVCAVYLVRARAGSRQERLRLVYFRRARWPYPHASPIHLMCCRVASE